MAANVKPLTISSLNCNGLGDHKKRKDLFQFLRQECPSNIYCLQETHLKASAENYIRASWGYDVWLAGSDTNRNGVAIFFNNNFEYKLHKVIKDKGGCFIIMDVEMLKKRITLVNLYGPSSGDDPSFLDKISRQIDQLGNDFVVAVGDWNCVLNMKLDLRNYLSAVYRPRTRKRIMDFMDVYDLVDIFRTFYPEKRSYTWRKFNSVKQSRLDYFLISEAFENDVCAVRTNACHLSDHSLISLDFKTEQIKRDRPFWKFNLSMLRDREYISGIKTVIKEVKQQYALPVYNLDKIECVPNEELQLLINDQLFFEVLLLEIRGQTIAYATSKKNEQKEREKKLIIDIDVLEKNVDDENLQELEMLKAELRAIREKKAEGMMIRSKVRWLNEGERNSKYFCNLENRNFVNKAVSFLDKGEDGIITDQKAILAEVQRFYSDLYSAHDVIDIDLDHILPDSPSVSPEDNEVISGPISYGEAAAALKEMKHDKTPGSDGLPAEFYKFFFVDIGQFLVRSVNLGLQDEKLSVSMRQGIITCIPKEDKPKQFLKNLRPISLLNVSYKIASSCIARRLQLVLPKLIHHSQTGFLKGRYIGENIRLLYDVLVFTEKQQIPGMLLLADLEKAFDSVSWSFIEKCLEFFKFDPCIVRWFRTLYKDAVSCVLVNGQHSSWFGLQRGCRQGDPISPYLYLICAEVLSLMIRRNSNIKGINVKGKEALLSQFADDTTLFLDGSERSLRAAIQTLNEFAEISGLKVNCNKTQIVWIGSMKNSEVRYLRDSNFQWNPGIFKVLGVKFSTDISTISDLNYDGKLSEIRRILNRWRKRQLTPFGKITVIKTLVMSKLTYLFLNIPDPSEEFLQQTEAELYRFLWDSKPSRIKKETICQPYELGGLRMTSVFSCLSSLKISWLRRLRLDNDSQLTQFVYNLFPRMKLLSSMGGEFASAIRESVDNCFWKDVLKHYRKLCCRCPPANPKEFMAEHIHYNIHIVRDKGTVYVKEWVDQNIVKISQLMNEHGQFLSYCDFKRKFPTILRTNFLLYEGIVSALRRYRDKFEYMSEVDSVFEMENKVWLCIEAGNKAVKNMLTETGTLPTAVERWNSTFEELDWKKIFMKNFSSTRDTQLRWFQSRLLHRILPTKCYLHKLEIEDSPLCIYCHQEEETINHLFWHCDVVQTFWGQLWSLLLFHCTHCDRFTLTEKLVIFGWTETTKTDVVIDFILLIAKFFIWKCRFQNVHPVLDNFVHLLKYRYKIERTAACCRGTIVDFEKAWLPYSALIDLHN